MKVQGQVKINAELLERHFMQFKRALASLLRDRARKAESDMRNDDPEFVKNSYGPDRELLKMHLLGAELGALLDDLFDCLEADGFNPVELRNFIRDCWRDNDENRERLQLLRERRGRQWPRH